MITRRRFLLSALKLAALGAVPAALADAQDRELKRMMCDGAIERVHFKLTEPMIISLPGLTFVDCTFDAIKHFEGPLVYVMAQGVEFIDCHFMKPELTLL